MSPRVIHTAQALVDVVVEVPALPRRGGNVMAPPPKEYAAGAVNILLAAARQGPQCVHAGATGTGPHGDLVRAALAAEGVHVSSPFVPDLDTGICVVMLEPTAERTFVTTQAAERIITRRVAADLAAGAGRPGLRERLQPHRADAGSVAAVARRAAAGVEVVLDPGAIFAELDDDMRERMLAMTTVWTGNAEESEALTGESDIVSGRRRSAWSTSRRARWPWSGTDPRGARSTPTARRPTWTATRRGGRHQRGRRHPHRSARRVPGRGYRLGRGRSPGQRRGSDQGDPARAGDRPDLARDRRVPRDEH